MRTIILIFCLIAKVCLGNEVAKQVYIVGSEQDFPPLALGNTDANADGFSVGLWKAVAEASGIPYQLKVKPFNQLLSDFKAGQIDILINLARSPERLEFANFSVPTVLIKGGIFVRNTEQRIQSEADLKNKRLIVIKSDLAHDYALQQGWQVVTVENAATGLSLLASGQHDAMLIGKLVGLQTLKQGQFSNLKLLPVDANFTQKFGIAVAKDRPELLAQINEGLAISKANGQYEALNEKWLGILEHEAHQQAFLAQKLLTYVFPASISLLLFSLYSLYRRKLEKQKAKKTLAALENRLQKIASRVPGVVYQYRLYPDGRSCFPYASDAIQDIYRVRPDEVQTDASKVIAILHPDDLNAIRASIQKSARLLTQWQMEYRVQFPDGCVRWLFGNALPQQEADDAVLWHGFITDITERKHAQLLFEQSQERLQFALQGANDGLWDWNLETNEVYYSPRWKSMLGYSEHELVADLDTWSLLIDPSQREHTLAVVMDYLAGKTPIFEVEFRMRHKQGHWVDILSRAKLALNDEGKPLTPQRLVGTHMDISERKSAENELARHRDQLQMMVEERTFELKLAKELAEQANEQKTEFLTNMSHELRTPMHAILSFAQLGIDNLETAGTEKINTYLNRIHTSAERLTKMLNDLLDSAKYETKHIQLEKKFYDIKKLSQESINEFESLVLNKSLQIVIEPSDCKTLAEIDPLKIGQVLRNILGNAIKFSPPHSVILVQFKATQINKGRRAADTEMIDALQIDISDQGIGIPEDELVQIFDKFAQSRKTKTKAGGSGLGLAISKSIIDAHHGRIYAYNNPEKGSTFSIQLPIYSIIFTQRNNR